MNPATVLEFRISFCLNLGCRRSHGVRVDVACAVVCDDECLASMSIVRLCVPSDVCCNVNV